MKEHVQRSFTPDVQRKVHAHGRAEAALRRVAESIKAEALDYREKASLAGAAARNVSREPRGEQVQGEDEDEDAALSQKLRRKYRVRIKGEDENGAQQLLDEAKDREEEGELGEFLSTAKQCLARLAQPTIAAQAHVDEKIESRTLIDPDAADSQEHPSLVTQDTKWSRKTKEGTPLELDEKQEHYEKPLERRSGVSERERERYRLRVPHAYYYPRDTSRQSPPWVEWPVAPAQMPVEHDALLGSDDDHELQQALSSVAPSVSSWTQISPNVLKSVEGVMRADDAIKSGQKGDPPTPMQASLLAFHNLRSQLLENVVNSKRIMKTLRGDDDCQARRGLADAVAGAERALLRAAAAAPQLPAGRQTEVVVGSGRELELGHERKSAQLLEKLPAQDHRASLVNEMEGPSMVADGAAPVGKASGSERPYERLDSPTGPMPLETRPSSPSILAPSLPCTSPHSGLLKQLISTSQPDVSLTMQFLSVPTHEPGEEEEEEVIFDSVTLSGNQEEEVHAIQHEQQNTPAATDNARHSNESVIREPTLAHTHIHDWLNLASAKLYEFCKQLPHVVTPAHLLRPRKLRPEIKLLLQQCSGLDPSPLV
jgi:hypothetical protein